MKYSLYHLLVEWIKKNFEKALDEAKIELKGGKKNAI